MNRTEFERKVLEVMPDGVEVEKPTDEEYEIIEKVYTFHPSISITEGKRQIAELYVNFGMSIIQDMKPRAAIMEKKEKELRAARAALEEVQKEIAEIRAGGEICGSSNRKLSGKTI